MLGYTLVDAFSTATRVEAIDRLKAAVAEADGVIVDFAFFEDGAIRLSVELAAGALATLASALEAAGVHLFEASVAELGKARGVVPPTKPITAMLHVALVDQALAVSA